jgi:hypothetical protein
MGFKQILEIGPEELAQPDIGQRLELVGRRLVVKQAVFAEKVAFAEQVDDLLLAVFGVA